MTSMCDLPADLVGKKILTRVPLTSLKAVRSTCKLWESLTKHWILGKAAATSQQFLGFMLKDLKVCSVRYHLCHNKGKEGEDLLDLSIKQVDLLNQVKICQVSQCDGLLLCLTEDRSRLVVWNPYLGQTKWIGLKTDFHEEESGRQDCYALGYDINRDHKILRVLHYCGKRVETYQIYELSSRSWRVLKVTRDWDIVFKGCVSVKGNTYFFAFETQRNIENGTIEDIEDFLICFDFTTETFGPRLPLPFTSIKKDTLLLSCVREEQLALIYQLESFKDYLCVIVEIWVTTTIEPNNLSWSKLLSVEMRPFSLLSIFRNGDKGASFFIDEEEIAAVVFDISGDLPKETCYPNTTYTIIREDCEVYPRTSRKGIQKFFDHPVVCSSSYLPSLVQLNQPHKRKERDG